MTFNQIHTHTYTETHAHTGTAKLNGVYVQGVYVALFSACHAKTKSQSFHPQKKCSASKVKTKHTSCCKFPVCSCLCDHFRQPVISRSGWLQICPALHMMTPARVPPVFSAHLTSPHLPLPLYLPLSHADALISIEFASPFASCNLQLQPTLR